MNSTAWNSTSAGDTSPSFISTTAELSGNSTYSTPTAGGNLSTGSSLSFTSTAASYNITTSAGAEFDSNATMISNATTTDRLEVSTGTITNSTTYLNNLTTSSGTGEVDSITTTSSTAKAVSSTLADVTSTLAEVVSTDGQDKTDDSYKSPLIAMSIIACLLFLILVTIFIMWWKRRGKTIYKTVTVIPKSKKAISNRPQEFADDIEKQDKSLELVKQGEGNESGETGVDNPVYQSTGTDE